MYAILHQVELETH